MNSLPVELFELVVNNIEIYERIKLRSVCKHWCLLISNLRPKSLIVSNKYEGIVTQRWFDTNQAIKFRENLLSNCKFNFLLSRSCVNILSPNVKELSIYNINYRNGSINFELVLNSFKHVVRLDLYAIAPEPCLVNLCLPDLQVVCIDCCRASFIIDSKHLLKFKYIESESEDMHVELLDPLTVEYAESNKYFWFLEAFKNLKYLYLDKCDGMKLSHFRFLKEIHLECSVPLLKNIQCQKDRLRLEKLTITNFGLRIDNLNDCEMIKSLRSDRRFSGEEVVIYVRNRSKISDKLPFITSLKFEGFEKILSDIPTDFFKKLTNLNEVIAKQKINDYQLFIELIKKCHPFPNLELRDTLLDQAFFDKLPDLCWYIQSLVLIKCFSTPDLNFDFVIKFKYLNTLRINRPITVSTIKMICSNLKLLKNFFFVHKGRDCSIKYHELENQFGLRLGSSPKLKFSRLDDILELLK